MNVSVNFRFVFNQKSINALLTCPSINKFLLTYLILTRPVPGEKAWKWVKLGFDVYLKLNFVYHTTVHNITATTSKYQTTLTAIYQLTRASRMAVWPAATVAEDAAASRLRRALLRWCTRDLWSLSRWRPSLTIYTWRHSYTTTKSRLIDNLLLIIHKLTTTQ